MTDKTAFKPGGKVTFGCKEPNRNAKDFVPWRDALNSCTRAIASTLRKEPPYEPRYNQDLIGANRRPRRPAACPQHSCVTIEVLDEYIGDQLEAVRLPWHTLVYDVRNELIELSVGGVIAQSQSFSGIPSAGR